MTETSADLSPQAIRDRLSVLYVSGPGGKPDLDDDRDAEAGVMLDLIRAVAAGREDARVLAQAFLGAYEPDAVRRYERDA